MNVMPSKRKISKEKNINNAQDEQVARSPSKSGLFL